uniref:Uncharacterized protein n=1 Tax=Arion vulgaris TaxID=1028688 RepID=A0A0B6ZMD8_9EUPU
MGLGDSAAYTCGTPKQYPGHILLDCRQNGNIANRNNPSETILQNKTMGER